MVFAREDVADGAGDFVFAFVAFVSGFASAGEASSSLCAFASASPRRARRFAPNARTRAVESWGGGVGSPGASAPPTAPRRLLDEGVLIASGPRSSERAAGSPHNRARFLRDTRHTKRLQPDEKERKKNFARVACSLEFAHFFQTK